MPRRDVAKAMARGLHQKSPCDAEVSQDCEGLRSAVMQELVRPASLGPLSPHAALLPTGRCGWAIWQSQQQEGAVAGQHAGGNTGRESAANWMNKSALCLLLAFGP